MCSENPFLLLCHLSVHNKNAVDMECIQSVQIGSLISEVLLLILPMLETIGFKTLKSKMAEMVASKISCNILKQMI